MKHFIIRVFLLLVTPFFIAFNSVVSFIGCVSLIRAFFQFRPSFTTAQIIQILFPSSLFGKVSWWFFFRVFQYTRKHHVHLLAGTGSGKSFFILQLILRDIQKGVGLLLIEPHSQLINIILHLKILQQSHPSQYCKKVVLLDFEHTKPPAFNIFAVPLPDSEGRREIKIHSLVQNYVEAFEKAFEIPPGARRVLKNVLIILFDHPNATILDVLDILQPRKRLPKKFEPLLNNISNPILARYFATDFFTAKSELSKEALRTRIEHLLTDRQLRLAMTQQGNALNVSQVLSQGKIVLVKAGQTIGVETSRFLGALVHQLILYGAFERVQQRYKKRFSIYLDECQNYVSNNVSKGLDEARKSHIQYLLAHQRLLQRDMTKDQQRALNGCAVKMYGRMDYQDAQRLSKQLQMDGLEARFLNLRPGEFYIKLGAFRTRFIKFSRSFAPPPEIIGTKQHPLFADEKQYCQLLHWLRKKSQMTSNFPTMKQKYRSLSHCSPRKFSL